MRRMSTRTHYLRPVVLLMFAALAAGLLTLVAASREAQSQTTPSGTLDANTLPPPNMVDGWSALVVGDDGLFGERRAAQTFTALNTGDVSSVQVSLVPGGSLDTPEVTVQIASVDESGVPTETVLATSTIPSSAVTNSSGEPVTVSFSSPAEVFAGEQYALVLSAPPTVSGSYYAWVRAEEVTLPDGQSWVDNAVSPSWFQVAGDTVFAIYVETDTSPPQFNLPDITRAATSASGATVNYTATATDERDGSVPATCSPASGTTFPIGTTTVTCTATDNAGNSASGSFDVIVEGATEQVTDLKDDIANLNLPAGTTTSLSFTLQQAQRSIEADNITAALEQLDAFILQVEALEQRKKISSQNAADLISSAEQIQGVLGG